MANFHVGQYSPLSDVAFAPFSPVMPHELPPSSGPFGQAFPVAWANKMLNIPGQSLYQIYNAGGQYGSYMTAKR